MHAKNMCFTVYYAEDIVIKKIRGFTHYFPFKISQVCTLYKSYAELRCRFTLAVEFINVIVGFNVFPLYVLFWSFGFMP